MKLVGMQQRIRSLALATVAAGLTATTAAPEAVAQAFPARPINVIVSTAPGDPGDVLARLVQPHMAERLGQPWVVEIRPGASGTIATQAVARAAPDGHTLLVVLSAHAINPLAIPNLPYDTLKDFAGVSLTVRQPLVVGVHPTVTGATLKDFIAQAKRQPKGAVAFGSPGIGSLSFLLGEEISRRADLGMVHVPFKGGGPAVQALLANEIQLSALIPAIFKPHIQAGRMRAIAVSSVARLPDLPDVPTYEETGFGGTSAYNWIGFFAPGRTPRDIVERLSSELAGALALPASRERLTGVGYEIVGSRPEVLDRLVADELARWGKFTTEFGVKFQ